MSTANNTKSHQKPIVKLLFSEVDREDFNRADKQENVVRVKSDTIERSAASSAKRVLSNTQDSFNNSVIISGLGQAIDKVVKIAEIVKLHSSNLYQLNTLSSVKYKETHKSSFSDCEDQVVYKSTPCLEILLTRDIKQVENKPYQKLPSKKTTDWLREAGIRSPNRRRRVYSESYDRSKTSHKPPRSLNKPHLEDRFSEPEMHWEHREERPPLGRRVRSRFEEERHESRRERGIGSPVKKVSRNRRDIKEDRYDRRHVREFSSESEEASSEEYEEKPRIGRRRHENDRFRNGNREAGRREGGRKEGRREFTHSRGNGYSRGDSETDSVDLGEDSQWDSFEDGSGRRGNWRNYETSE